MTPFRNNLCAALLSSVLAAPLCIAAHAAEKFPSHPIQLIVPTPPGGGTDVAARLLASLAEQTLGQKIIVVDKPGAGGAIGVEEMLRAAPDGYTIATVWNSPLTITPQMFPVSYKPDSYCTLRAVRYFASNFLCHEGFPGADRQGTCGLA